MTNGWTDVANADVILVMGGNPAENHPVGFRFAIEAKRKRKAKIVTIDPRFNRTAAVSDVYVPLRAGSDIAFLGGLIHYALTKDLYQREYVKLHTNASFLVKEGFSFSDGLFSGWDETKKAYDKSSWGYELDAAGYAKVDMALEHPRSVFQLMKQHYSRYTPEMVASICGCTAKDFERAAEIICSTGKADRQGTVLYALGWTQHSHSVQLIHTAAMLQLMLGNIGMPGGGVNAQRGHSNIQGATDMGAWNMLPGYLRLPRANQQDLKTYLQETTPKALRPNSLNYLSNTPKFMSSLLKAYYGEKATKSNDFAYELLPKLDEADNYSWGYIFDRMYAGRLEGMISFGMNPVANGPNTTKMLGALAKLKWLIVAECFETETAAFWKAKEAAGEYYPAAPDPSAINTEVFMLPAACFAEKDGAFVNSSRWAQWKNIALDPPGEAWRDQDIIARLFLKIRELYQKEGGTAPEPLFGMTWNWQNALSPSLAEVSREINGRDAAGHQITTFGALADDGSTICGNWIYAGSFTDAGNMMARRGQEDPTGLGLFPNWAWNWPANRRILYNRASVDASGNPWDASRAPLRWSGTNWSGDVPDYKGDAKPEDFGAFIMLAEGVAKLYAVDFAEGRSRSITNRLSLLPRMSCTQKSAAILRQRFSQAMWTGSGHLPSSHISARRTGLRNISITGRKTSPGRASFSRTSSWKYPMNLRGRRIFRRRHGARPFSPRFGAGPCDGDQANARASGWRKTVYQIGLPIHWGFIGRVTGPLINNLSPSVMDPNSGTPEYKGFLVNIEKV
jgi:formate dehydrogenase major subunit